MSFPICQLTSGPDDGNKVYLDLNDVNGGIFLSQGSGGTLSFGEPSFTSTPFQMIEGTRQIQLPVMITGSPAQVSARSSVLSRTLARPLLWLYWQTDASTKPVWFRLIRNQVGSFNFSTYPMSQGQEQKVWEWDLTLMAHSFAYGERVTIPSFTINRATGTASTFSQELPAIKGDVPTYFKVDMKPGYGGGVMRGFETLVNISSCDTTSTYNGAPQWGLDSLSIQNGAASIVGVPSGLSSYGSSGRVVSIQNNTFDGKAPQTIVAGSAKVPIAWGQYQAYVRVMRNGDDGAAHVKQGTINLDGSYDMYGNSYVWNPPAGPCASWLDCGQVSYPAGLDSSTMNASGGIAYSAPFALAFSGGQFGSTTTTYLDQVVLVPNHIAGGGTSTTMKMAWQGGSFPGGGIHIAFDGDYQRAGLMDDNGMWQYALAPMITGGWPQLVPGYRNFFTTLMNTNSAGVDNAGASVSVSMNYMPRYLGIGVA